MPGRVIYWQLTHDLQRLLLTRTRTRLRTVVLILGSAIFISSAGVQARASTVYVAPSSPMTPRQLTNALRVRAQDGAGSQSLTFGFTFMAILLFLLFFAHVMQRWANRRQRELRDRMAMVREAHELERMPMIWDVHLRQRDKLRWCDIQPLAACVAPTEAVLVAKRSPAEPHSRPLHVSMIISMPVSPSSGGQREKSSNEPGSNRHVCYELGVMKVK